MHKQGLAVKGRQASRRDAATRKGKEGTKSDDSFPQRGYEINPKVAKKSRRSTANCERGQEKVDEFSEGARQAKKAGEALAMARELKEFDEISAGNQKRGKNKIVTTQQKFRRKKKRGYKDMICMAPKSKTEGKGDTPTYT